MEGLEANRWDRWLFGRVDISSIVLFRIAFGGIMVWEVTRFVGKGWLDLYFAPGQFHVTYPGFGWVRPWNGAGMYYHFYAIGVAAVCVVLGLFYRFSVVVLGLLWTYVWLIEQGKYNNHYYFVSLVALVMLFVPAHRAFSLDAWMRPGLRSSTAPGWALWLLRFNIGLPYFFGGVAKIYPEWLSGDIARLMLANRCGNEWIGMVCHSEWAVLLMTWGGMLFDLLVVPGLIWRRTRVLFFVMALGFHLSNAFVFSIGIFPWLMMLATTIYFEPGWVRRVVGFVTRGWVAGRLAIDRGVVVPGGWRRKMVVWLFGGYVVVHCLLPFRHYLYPGDCAWTDEGQYFAWRMKLRVKSAMKVKFVAEDPDTGKSGPFNPLKHVSPRLVMKMAKNPEGVRQFAHHVGEKLRSKGHPNIRIYAYIRCRLNRHREQWLIDPGVDLLSEKGGIWGAKDWIVPLKPEKIPLEEVRPVREEEDLLDDLGQILGLEVDELRER